MQQKRKFLGLSQLDMRVAVGILDLFLPFGTDTQDGI